MELLVITPLAFDQRAVQAKQSRAQARRNDRGGHAAGRLGEDPKCGKCGAPVLDGKPVALTDATFDKFVGRSDLPVVVDFWAEWCGPCKIMAPAFEQAAAGLKIRVRFAKLDTEQAQGIAARFGIRSIPTMILFKGGQEAARTAGAMDARRIRAWLESQT
jgi:thioredoxin 2